MSGEPLFQAVMTITFPDQSTCTMTMLWAATGHLIPYGGEDQTDKLLAHMALFGESVDADMRVALDDDPSVVAEVDWDNEQGFVPLGTALADWVRKTRPNDCAYLDEVRLEAHIQWDAPDGLKFSQRAWWLTTGEVRPRFNFDGAEDDVRFEEKLWRVMMADPDSLHNKGTVSLDADPAVQSVMAFEEESRQWLAPHEALAGATPA